MIVSRKSFALLALAGVSAFATATDVTELGTYPTPGAQGWLGYGFNGGGAASIGGQSLDGDGALQMNGDRARAGIGILDNGAGVPAGAGTPFSFGTLGNLAAGSMSFDLFRDIASNANPEQSFAVKLFFENGDSLTWENVHQTVQFNLEGVWNNDREIGGTTGKWWYRDVSANLNYNNGGQYYTLAEFAAGQQATNGGNTSDPLSASNLIVGVSFGLGSGIPGGSYSGAVDDLKMNFGNGGSSYAYNFGTGASAVPGPAAMSAFALGLASRLRRRKHA